MRRKTVKYRWRKSGQFGGERKAQLVGKALASLSRGSKLAPEDVVKAARAKSSPLHYYFEWDDSVAARKHRLAQARELQRSIQVVSVGDGGEVVAPMFVNLREAGTREGSDYELTVSVLSNKEKRARLVKRALDAAEAWQGRYSNLSELADIFKAIEKAKRRAKRRKAG